MHVAAKVSFLALVATVSLGACGSDNKANPFMTVPDCMGVTISQGHGDRQLVMSSLDIADLDEGIDLNGDGMVDNKLSVLGGLLNQQLDENMKRDHDIVLPFELFGYMGADSACTKLQLYKADFNKDRDADMVTTTWNKGDCDDTNPNINPNKQEDLTNRVDDDCDGYADNMTKGAKPDDTQDLDGDGYTLAMGDCDDRNDAAHIDLAKSRHPGATEICDNGIDDDCDGIPDNGPGCDPTGTAKPPLTIDSTIPPIPIGFGDVKGGVYSAGPGTFSVNLPPIKGAMIHLALIGVRFQYPLSDGSSGTSVTGGLLGGVLGAQALAETTGLDADKIISAEQTLLDAIFVGQIGTILGLDKDPDGHILPDMDIDGDGLETFWEEGTPSDGIPKIDACKDGNGDIIRNNFDGNGTPCYLATDAKGNLRFVDGISIALKVNAVPATIAQ
jgi:hypothetical protein